VDNKAGEPRQWQELSGKAEIELEDAIVGLKDIIESGSDEDIIIEILFNRNSCFAFTIY